MVQPTTATNYFLNYETREIHEIKNEETLCVLVSIYCLARISRMQPQNRRFRFAYGAVIAHCVGRGRSVQGSLFQVNVNSAPYVNVNDGLDLVH